LFGGATRVELQPALLENLYAILKGRSPPRRSHPVSGLILMRFSFRFAGSNPNGGGQRVSYPPQPGSDKSAGR